MEKINITANSLTVTGDFDINSRRKPNKDLSELIEIATKQLFKAKSGLIIFVGFAEIDEKKDILEELKNNNITFMTAADYLLMAIIDSNSLHQAFVLWAEYAGGAGEFKFIISKENDIEIFKRKFIAGNVMDDDVILEDISDGDKNRFLLREK